MFTEFEEKNIRKFRTKHFKKHGNISSITIELSSTGIGDIVIVKCPSCKEEKDVTDYDNM